MSHRNPLHRSRSGDHAPRLALGVVIATVLLCAAGPDAAAQQMPFVIRSPDGSMHIWTVDEPTGMAVPEIDDVTFLSIRLTGHAPMDRLRTDRPRLEGSDSPAPHIRLPGGGALYRIQSGVETALLRITANGTPELLVSIPSQQAGPSLQEAVFVSADGRTAAVATEHAAGGDVIIIRLDGVPTHYVVTKDENPLRVEADTLRASTQGVWFVASGELRRAKPTAARSRAVDFDLLRATVLPDLVLDETGTRVGAVVRYEHRESAVSGDRHVFAVDIAGPPIRVSDRPADYDLPSLGEQTGPLMALGPDGNSIVFRRTSRPDELLARRISPRSTLQHVRSTDASEGGTGAALHGIHFTQPNGFWFLESGSTAFACLLDEQAPVVTPFGIPGDLRVIDAVADPSGTHAFLTTARGSAASETYVLYEIDPDAPLRAVQRLARGLATRPRLVALGSSVAVITGPSQGDLAVDAADIQLHAQLIERALPGQPPMILLSPGQAGVELSRFAVSPTGRLASFVAGTGSELVMPTYLDLRSGELRKASKESVAVSPVLAFSSTGALLVGIGDGHDGFAFGSFKEPREGARAELPRSYGFPLQH